MKYQVVRIDEDIDFGCEERSADEPVMAVVVLQDENGNESRIRQEDQMLYDRNIEEGDTVIRMKTANCEKYSPVIGRRIAILKMYIRQNSST